MRQYSSSVLFAALFVCETLALFICLLRLLAANLWFNYVVRDMAPFYTEPPN
jgi:hypothetical protein